MDDWRQIEGQKQDTLVGQLSVMNHKVDLSMGRSGSRMEVTTNLDSISTFLSAMGIVFLKYP
jgi:hypothetical protein